MNRTAERLWQLSLFHLRGLYRNKIAFFFNLIFPLLMVATFGTMYGHQTASTPPQDGFFPVIETIGRPLNAFDYLMPGQMAVMLLSAGFITVSIGVAGQRQNGSMRHLLSTPLSVGGWTFARVVANLLMAVIQGALLFAFGALLFDVAPPANLPGTLVVVAVSTFMSLSLGLLLGLVVKGEYAAMTVGMPVFMVLLFLGNSAVPLVDVPPVIERILPWIPSYHMTEALRAVMMFGQSVRSVVTELGILVAIGAVAMVLSLWLMRRQFVMR